MATAFPTLQSMHEFTAAQYGLEAENVDFLPFVAFECHLDKARDVNPSRFLLNQPNPIITNKLAGLGWSRELQNTWAQPSNNGAPVQLFGIVKASKTTLRELKKADREKAYQQTCKNYAATGAGGVGHKEAEAGMHHEADYNPAIMFLKLIELTESTNKVNVNKVRRALGLESKETTRQIMERGLSHLDN